MVMFLLELVIRCSMLLSVAVKRDMIDHQKANKTLWELTMTMTTTMMMMMMFSSSSQHGSSSSFSLDVHFRLLI